MTLKLSLLPGWPGKKDHPESEEESIEEIARLRAAQGK